ncbi:MAG: hypothetical protein ABI878_16125, partial [Acidobacteriota bacterium]
VERASWFGNFAKQFALIASGLGFTQADIDAVNADNAMLQFLSARLLQTENYVAAVKAFQRTITSGRNGTLTPNFPLAPDAPMPAAVPTGIFERLERLVRRIRVATGFGPQIGAALGITPRIVERLSSFDTQPLPKVSVSANAYTFIVRVTRGLFDGFVVEIKRSSSSSWETPGSFVVSPAEVTIVPLKRGEPEILEVRIRMLKGNKMVGPYSDVHLVTVTP